MGSAFTEPRYMLWHHKFIDMNYEKVFHKILGHFVPFRFVFSLTFSLLQPHQRRPQTAMNSRGVSTMIYDLICRKYFLMATKPFFRFSVSYQLAAIRWLRFLG